MCSSARPNLRPSSANIRRPLRGRAGRRGREDERHGPFSKVDVTNSATGGIHPPVREISRNGVTARSIPVGSVTGIRISTASQGEGGGANNKNKPRGESSDGAGTFTSPIRTAAHFSVRDGLADGACNDRQGGPVSGLCQNGNIERCELWSVGPACIRSIRGVEAA